MAYRYYIALIIYCAFIFWSSSHSDLPEPDLEFPGRDKVMHLILYGIMAAIISVGINGATRAPTAGRQWLLPILFVLVYGISDELHQLFVPNRNFDPWDIVANVGGAILVQLVLCGYRWRVPLPWSATERAGAD